MSFPVRTEFSSEQSSQSSPVHLLAQVCSETLWKAGPPRAAAEQQLAECPPGKEKHYSSSSSRESLRSHLLFSVFDVLVFISTVRRDLLAGVDTILRGAPDLGGLFLLVAGAGPASSSHGSLTSVQYLQGSEIQ